jgi:hypothetical protein
MRFPIDVVFLDARGLELERRPWVRPRRILTCRHAAAVVEIPSEPGGEGAGVRT